MKIAANVIVALLASSTVAALQGGYLSGGSAMKSSSVVPNIGRNFASVPRGSALFAVEGGKEPVLVAIDKLHDNMNSNQMRMVEILKDINSNMGNLVNKVQANKIRQSAGEPPAETTELVSALEASSAPTASSYLSQMGGGAGGTAAPGPSGSYAPTKSNVVQKSGGAGFGSYLDGV